MKNMFLLEAGVSLLAGCATKEMKTTPFYEGGEVMYSSSSPFGGKA